MHTQRPGRHELGQNFLIDRNVIDAFVGLVAATEGPIIEIGPGDGALTLPMRRLGRPLTGVEIDGRQARRLARRLGPPAEVVHADFLRHPLPATPHVLAGNLPFHQTTVMLRRILDAPGWTDAVLITQWEVARRRAGVGGASMMTAQWWPWFEFRLHQRVPSSAFRPRPGVDGGLLTATRRRLPLVQPRARGRYQDVVRRVFTGRGRGIAEILTAMPEMSRHQALQWTRRHGVAPSALPKVLVAEQWADLFLRHFPPARDAALPGRRRGLT
ncbi:23S ribosomal RNA methyltransferase Erm [Actinocorallia populi]|uniref:23S ribosomal RNA methyltransferase Erm n=1 Tax=Actinocorallia populi TaxID=2079200 RepID=UPI000D089907|nr:23S ribosomal RNA methyltransferase Erm [Actinocorallia populi]